MTPLEIVAFLDGRPGHEKQTKGVLNSLSGMTPVRISYRTVPIQSAISGLKDGLGYLFEKILFPSQRTDQIPVDLIFGTGAHTHIPMLRLKKRTGSYAATCMSPSYPLIREMDLCFVPEHDNPDTAPNLFVTTGPPNTVRFRARHDPSKGLILVGGIDSKSHRWHTETTVEQIQAILRKESVIAWTLSSSPRTPADTLEALEKLPSLHSNVEFFRSQSTPSGWIEQQYSENRTVWVTADSVSMVYEAMTAGCRVGVLPVEWKRKESKFQKSIQTLTAQRWVTTFDAWLKGQDPPSPPRRLDEADRCAREILRRWWPNRLP